MMQQPSYSITPPKADVIRYLADTIRNKDRWIIVFPIEMIEEVCKRVVRLPDPMLLMDNGKPEMWVCGGIEILVPASQVQHKDPDTVGVVVTLPKDLVPPEALSRLFAVPTPQDEQAMIALCTDPNRVPVPLFFIEALRIGDPATAALIEGREVP